MGKAVLAVGVEVMVVTSKSRNCNSENMSYGGGNGSCCSERRIRCDGSIYCRLYSWNCNVG